MSISLHMCSVTPYNEMPEPLTNHIDMIKETGAFLEEEIIQITFLMGRLWTYSLATERPIFLAFVTEIGGVIFGYKMNEDGYQEMAAPLFPQNNLVTFEYAMQFAKQVCESQDGVMCDKLNRLLIKI